MAACASALGDYAVASKLLHGDRSSQEALPSRAMAHRKSSLKQDVALLESEKQEKRSRAQQHAEAGDFIRAWELFDEIGDRTEAQFVLAKARSSIERCNLPHSMCAPMDDPRSHAEYFQVNEQTCMSRPSTAGLSRASESRRPSSASVENLGASGGALFEADNHDLAKALRNQLGINRRKVSKVREIFLQWCRDKSSAMSKAEFRAGLLESRPFTMEEEIESAFSAADVDREGFINEEQFAKWLFQV
jgi:hypothetical protein